MNDQIKKQTNLGIVLAIIGFTMVGGALVLVPRLVDEKVKSLQALEKSQNAKKGTDADNTGVAQSNQKAKVSGAAASAPSKGAETDAAAKNASDASGAPDQSRVGKGTPGESSHLKKGTSSTETGPWELVLADKYEPDDASKVTLDAIVAMMKSTPGLRLRVVGMNNINKMSRLAQIGANRITSTIVTDAAIAPERIETAVEQQPDMTDIRVKISVVGGAQ